MKLKEEQVRKVAELLGTSRKNIVRKVFRAYRNPESAARYAIAKGTILKEEQQRIVESLIAPLLGLNDPNYVVVDMSSRYRTIVSTSENKFRMIDRETSDYVTDVIYIDDKMTFKEFLSILTNTKDFYENCI